MNPASGPKTSPTAMIRKVHGCTLGMAANGMREAAIMAPRMPIRATSLELTEVSSNRPKNVTRRSSMKAFVSNAA